MTSYVTLNEAASYLGVSKATLRNWDKAGKLRAVRHPINKYRVYVLSDLQQIKSCLPLNDNQVRPHAHSTMDGRTTRAFISRLHNLIRDLDSHSNIIERFDELTKLLFFKLCTEEGSGTAFSLARLPNETDKAYATRVRSGYNKVAQIHKNIIPAAFDRLITNDKTICACADVLAQISFENVAFDVKGLAYEEIIRNTFDKNDNQQFFTPPTIVKFMVEMLRPVLKGNICDPASGTAGFLVEILKSGIPHSSLTAIEIDERLAWVSGINLFTHGADKSRAHWLADGGTLGSKAKTFFEKFDGILTNPPFGSDFTDAKLLSTYQLGGGRTSRRRGILFLERCYQLLKPEGVLAFIIDEGVLNLPSAEDVRRFLTEKFEIQAIVSLPETAFMPYATVNASILFLKKMNRNKPKKYETFFAKAENIGRKGNGDDDFLYDETGSSRLNSDLPHIVELFHTFQHTGRVPHSEYAYVADIFSDFREEENGWRLDFRYHHPSRKLSRSHLARTKKQLLPLIDICQERNQTLIPSNELADQTILYTGLAHIESETGIAHQSITPANSLKSAVKRYEPGDIIFAKMRPNLRKVALMNFKEGGYASPECIVLTVKQKNGRPIIDPLLLSILLRSDLVYGQIMHLIAGMGRPRLAVSDLRRILIPSTDYESQKIWRAKYLAEISSAKRLKQKADRLLQDATQMEKTAVEQLAGEFL